MEQRIVKTLLSRPPKPIHLIPGLSLLLLMLWVSKAYWSKKIWAVHLAASPSDTQSWNEFWKLITTCFLHGDPKHFLSNSAPFLLLSTLITTYFGHSVFIIQFLLSALGVTYFSLASYSENTVLIGMSGVVYSFGAFWLFLYLCLDRRYNLKQRFVRSLLVATVTLLPSTYSPDVSYRAHFIGFLFGGVMGAFYFFWKKKTLRSYEEYLFVEDEPMGIEDEPLVIEDSSTEN